MARVGINAESWAIPRAIATARQVHAEEARSVLLSHASLVGPLVGVNEGMDTLLKIAQQGQDENG